MKNQRNLIIGLILSLIGVIFVILNTNPVAINFGFAKPELPLVVVLVIMVLLGALLTFFLGRRDYPANQKEFARKLNAQKKSYEKQLADMEKQVNKLNEEIAKLKKDE